MTLFDSRHMRTRQEVGAACLCLVTILGISSPRLGYTAEWANPMDGLFHHPSNWVASTPPGTTDEAEFVDNGSYTVTFNQNAATDRLTVRAGQVTFNLNDWTYSVLHDISGLPGLRVGGGGSVAPSLKVTDGELRINSGTLGEGIGQEGGLIVDGSNARFHAEVNLVVGNFGVGRMTVNNGGRATADNVLVGVAGASQDFSILGVGETGSRLDIANTLHVGQVGGRGQVVAIDGGTITAGELRIAQASNSLGNVMSLLPGSLIHIQGDARVGEGEALLEASLGGTVRIDGELRYDGNGSVHIENTGHLDVGSITRGDESSGSVRLEEGSMRVRGDATTFDLGLGVIGHDSELKVDGTLTLDPRRSLLLGSPLSVSSTARLIVGSIAGDGDFNVGFGTLEIGTLTLGDASGLRKSLHVGGANSLPLPIDRSRFNFNVTGSTDIQEGGDFRITRGTATFTGHVSNLGLFELDNSHATFPNSLGFPGVGGLLSGGEIRIIDSTTSGFVMPGFDSVMKVGGNVVFNGSVRTAVDISRTTPEEQPSLTFNGGLWLGPLTSQLADVTIDASVAFGAGNTLTMEIGGTDAGMFDRLNVTGPLLLDGSLEVIFLSDYTPASGNEFVLFSAENISGQFAGLSLPPLPPGLEYNVAALNAGVLQVVPEPSGLVLLGLASGCLAPFLLPGTSRRRSPRVGLENGSDLFIQNLVLTHFSLRCEDGPMMRWTCRTN